MDTFTKFDLDLYNLYLVNLCQTNKITSKEYREAFNTLENFY